jgi:hypothetical protein
MERKRIKIAAVQRRNSGIWDETFNPQGTARVYVDGAPLMSYLAPEGTITSLADCFNHDLIATIDVTDPSNASRLSTIDDGTDNPDVYKVTGTIASGMSGRPDGLYTDEINERDVEDLRMSAHKLSKKDILNDMLVKLDDNDIRGKESMDLVNIGKKLGVVVPLGTSGESDDVHTYYPSVLLEDGIYKMWYGGHDGSHYRIHYAESTDTILIGDKSGWIDDEALSTDRLTQIEFNETNDKVVKGLLSIKTPYFV